MIFVIVALFSFCLIVLNITLTQFAPLKNQTNISYIEYIHQKNETDILDFYVFHEAIHRI